MKKIIHDRAERHTDKLPNSEKPKIYIGKKKTFVFGPAILAYHLKANAKVDVVKLI